MTQQPGSQSGNSTTINQQEATRIGRVVGERVQRELEQRFTQGQRQATAQEVIDATRTLDWSRFISEAAQGTQAERSTSGAKV